MHSVKQSQSRRTTPTLELVKLMVVGAILGACTSGSSMDPTLTSLGAAASTETTATTGAAPPTVSEDGQPAPSETTAASTAPLPTPSEGECRENAQSVDGIYLTFAAFCGDFPALYPLSSDESRQPTLTEMVEALIRGTAEEHQELGFWTGFDGGIAHGVEVSTTVDQEGVLRIELTLDGEPWNPDVSASAETLAIYDPLVATVFLDHDVAALDLDGLCWGELDCTDTLDRRTWDTQLFLNQGVLTYRSRNQIELCGLNASVWDPEHCTVDGAFAALNISGTVTNVAAGDTLNLRSGPGVEYPVVAEAAPDSSIVASGLRAASAGASPWRLVRDLGGTAGWANEAFLDLPRSPVEITTDAFVEFARTPSTDSFAALPMASVVSLGLGADIDLPSVPAQSLVNPANWIIDRTTFRAYEGPFSALDLLSRVSVFNSLTDDHPHCASPPVPAPDGFEDHGRIAIQPARTTIDSCLQWFTIDLFVDDSGQVEAITLDLWEP